MSDEKETIKVLGVSQLRGELCTNNLKSATSKADGTPTTANNKQDQPPVPKKR